MTRLRQLEEVSEHAMIGLSSGDASFALSRISQGVDLPESDQAALGRLADRFAGLRDEAGGLDRAERAWQREALQVIEQRSGAAGAEETLGRLTDTANRAATGEPWSADMQELMEFLSALSEHELGRMHSVRGGCF